MTHGFRGEGAPLIVEELTAVYDEVPPVEVASSRVRDILTRAGVINLLGADSLLQAGAPAPNTPQSPTVTESAAPHTLGSDWKDQ